jgi:hypothetical protein
MSGTSATTTDLIRNERRKLLANALDRFSTGLLLSTLLPLYTLSRTDTEHPVWVYAASAGGFVVAAVLLHLQAHRVLGGLR